MKEKKEQPKKRQRRRIEILGIDDWDDIKVDGAESTDSTDDTDVLPGIDHDPKDQDEAAAADESTDVDEAADVDATADVTNADTDAANDDGLDGYAKAARALLDSLAADADAAADAAVDTAADAAADDAADDDMSAAADTTDTTDTADSTLGTYYHKEGKNMVKSLDFYNNLGTAAFNFDRGMPMDASLRDWLTATIAADEQLATDSLKHLATMLEEHPKLIDNVREIVERAEETAIPYFVGWKNKVTRTVFFKKEDAEENAHDLIAAGVTDFDKMFEIARYKYDEYGIPVEVDDNEIVAFYKEYKGNKKKLRELLLIPEQPKKQQPAKGKPDKKSDDQDQPEA